MPDHSIPYYSGERLPQEFSEWLSTIPKGSRDEIGSDGRWKLHIPKSEQTAILEKAGFKVVFQEQISLYNGSDWILTISVALSK